MPASAPTGDPLLVTEAARAPALGQPATRMRLVSTPARRQADCGAGPVPAPGACHHPLPFLLRFCPLRPPTPHLAAGAALLSLIFHDL